MKIVMTFLVRDEQDILQYNIDFHRAQGVDFFIIMDNLSEDGTKSIAERYVGEGIARYVFQSMDDYSQSQWVTEMARTAFTEYNADWIINNDADEFWFPRKGDLKQAFTSVAPEFNTLLAQRTNFVPIAATENDEPFFKTMIYREVESLNAVGVPLPPKMAHRGSADVVVSQGNHSVSGASVETLPECPIEILHFPLRSFEQFQNKIAKGGAAYERNRDLPKSTGITWRQLYSLYKENGLMDHYIQEAYDQNRIEQELATGDLIEDRRLLDFFKRISG